MLFSDVWVKNELEKELRQSKRPKIPSANLFSSVANYLAEPSRFLRMPPSARANYDKKQSKELGFRENTNLGQFSAKINSSRYMENSTRF